MIAGIDFSLNGTGITIINGSKKPIKTYLFTTKKTLDVEGAVHIPPDLIQEERLDWVCTEILKKVKGADFVCLEQQIGLSFSWADGYGILKHELRKANVPYITIAPTAAKSYAGTGAAHKGMMAQLLKDEYGFDFGEYGKGYDNIVDSCWLSIIGADFIQMTKNNAGKINNKRLGILNNILNKQHEFITTFISGEKINKVWKK